MNILSTGYSLQIVYMTVLSTGGISLDKNLDKKSTSFYVMGIIRLCKDVLRIAHILCCRCSWVTVLT